MNLKIDIQILYMYINNNPFQTLPNPRAWGHPQMIERKKLYQVAERKPLYDQTRPYFSFRSFQFGTLDPILRTFVDHVKNILEVILGPFLNPGYWSCRICSGPVREIPPFSGDSCETTRVGFGLTEVSSRLLSVLRSII